MKKKIILSILSLWVLFLAGCGPKQADETQVTSQTNPVPPADQLQDKNILYQPINKKNAQPKNSEYKGWKTYYNQAIGLKFRYPNFFENIEENTSDKGMIIYFNINIQPSEKNSFFAEPIFRIFIIDNKNISHSDYQIEEAWQKITKTWKIGGQNAIFIENREARPFDLVVIEHPAKQNSVIEFYAYNGLVNGQDFVVDLNKIVDSIEFIK
jgi:hypothetical protein